MIGTVLFSAALGKSAGLPILGWAIALMVGGLVVPLELAPAVAVLAGALAAGGFLAAVLCYFTRGQAASYATS